MPYRTSGPTLNQPSEKTGWQFEVRHTELDEFGLSHSPRRRFDTLKEAEEYIALVEKIPKRGKVPRSLAAVDAEHGRRVDAKQEIENYIRDELKSGAFKPGHAKNVRRVMLRFLGDRIQYFDQVTVEFLMAFKASLASIADLGIKSLGVVRTVFRRLKLERRVRFQQVAYEWIQGVRLPKLHVRSTARYGIWQDGGEAVIHAFSAAEGKVLVHDNGTVSFPGNDDEGRKVTNTLHDLYQLLPLVVFLMRYGFRPGHAMELRIHQWDPTTRCITIPETYGNKPLPRLVYVDQRTAQLIDRAIGKRSAQEYIFIPARTRSPVVNPRWNPVHAEHKMNQYLRLYGLPGTSYWMRHTACTLLALFFKGDLQKVMAITGHKKESTLKRYLHVIPQEGVELVKFYESEDVRSQSGQRKPLRLAARRGWQASEHDQEVAQSVAAVPAVPAVEMRGYGDQPAADAPVVAA